MLEAQESIRAATASVDRARSVVAVIKPLVDQNLRPGADAARADAELANAETNLARAEQLRDVRRAELSAAIGNASVRVDAVPGSLLAPVNDAEARAPFRVETHPLVIQATAAVDRSAKHTGARHTIKMQPVPRRSFKALVWVLRPANAGAEVLLLQRPARRGGACAW